jgi:signal transduction histidine kinase
MKHAKASEIEVNIHYHVNTMTLIISDNGKGFEKNEKTQQKEFSLGHSGMQRRAAIIKAGLHITSSPVTAL